MNLNLIILCLIFLGSYFIGKASLRFLASDWQRFILIGMLTGFFVYNGIGISYPDVHLVYALYYFIFFIVLVFSYLFFLRVLYKLSYKSSLVLPIIFKEIDKSPVWIAIIFSFFFFDLIPLFYPELRIDDLFKPQLGYLPYLIILRFENEPNLFLKLVQYGQWLLTPFFYISLYRFRNRLHLAAMLIILHLYISYVVNNFYLGRGQILMSLFVLILAMWMSRPEKRRLIGFLFLISLPFILILSYVYSIIRIGGDIQQGPIKGAIQVIEIETSFPINGSKIIEYGLKADLKNYATWLITLPLPKILTGELKRAEINYEISELLLNKTRGELGYYIKLAGLLGESIYLFGRYFFWFNGIFIGILAAFIVRILERTPQLIYLNAYVTVLLSYALNRGGVNGFLPFLINHFMLFYMLVFISLLRMPKRLQI